MPAARSRNVNWRRTLMQIQERHGALEVALAPPEPVEAHRSGDLVWRVRLLKVGLNELAVEMPRALGRTIEFPAGSRLVAAAVVGQNRWMFHTTVLAAVPGADPNRPGCMVLEIPDHLERCQRLHGRYDARGLHLPEVDCWPLLDPSSVIPIERATECALTAFRLGESFDLARLDGMRPTVGPRFPATLMNIGGGGIGVRVGPGDAPVLAHHPVLWVRIVLGEIMPVPIVASVKVVHTHIDSAQMTYAGLAFDFSFNPRAQSTVTQQILLMIQAQQKRRPLRAA